MVYKLGEVQLKQSSGRYTVSIDGEPDTGSYENPLEAWTHFIDTVDCRVRGRIGICWKGKERTVTRAFGGKEDLRVGLNRMEPGELVEIRLPELSAEDRKEWETTFANSRGEIQFADECDSSVFIAVFSVAVRYIRHCVEKGWKPSLRGLQGFIKMERLGYYKTLLQEGT